MKRWLFTFIGIIVLSKFVATSMLKLMPETTSSILDKVSNVEKAVTSFKFSPDTKIEVAAPVSIPKTSGPTKAFLAYTQAVQPAIAPAPKKIAKVVKTAAEDKARRKTRKKKLEAAATKKKAPELTVIKLANKEEKRLELPVFATGSNILINARKDLTPAAIVKPSPVAATQKVDLAGWVKLLTQNPASSDFKTFLGLYKSGAINSQEYYAVVGAMQKSPIVEARRLAVMGSSVEANAQAFQILVHEKYEEKDTTIQALASQRLQVYKDLKYLSSLTTPLTNGDALAKTEASNTIGLIAQGVVATPSSLTADSKQWFTRFITILTPISKDPSSNVLQVSATQTLSILKSILG